MLPFTLFQIKIYDFPYTISDPVRCGHFGSSINSINQIYSVDGFVMPQTINVHVLCFSSSLCNVRDNMLQQMEHTPYLFQTKTTISDKKCLKTILRITVGFQAPFDKKHFVCVPRSFPKDNREETSSTVSVSGI